jgi:integral membrane protein
MKNLFSLLGSALGKFRFVAFTEGVSYLILLFIAMPLKHFMDKPAAVKTVGAIHGGLFILYVVWVVICHFEYNWQWRKTAVLFLMSLVPFGNFYADRHYLRQA